jgi:hypothetical protein
MKWKNAALDHVIGGLLKLDPSNRERQNVIACLQSCYGGLVRDYDFDAAMISLDKLSDEEHGALAEYVVECLAGQRVR